MKCESRWLFLVATIIISIPTIIPRVNGYILRTDRLMCSSRPVIINLFDLSPQNFVAMEPPNKKPRGYTLPGKGSRRTGDDGGELDFTTGASPISAGGKAGRGKGGKGVQWQGRGRGQGKSKGASLPQPAAAPVEPCATEVETPEGPSPAPAGPPRKYQGPLAIDHQPFNGNEGQGIVHSLGLNKKTGEWANPVESRRLRVCASSLVVGTLAMTVDHENYQLLFQSDDLPYSWVLFDFQECSVRPSRYTLAHKSDIHAFFMRSWQVEGSDNNEVWHILSRHNSDGTLCPDNLVGGWDLKTNAFYRYIRIVLDPGGNSEGGSALLFNCFDIYGDFQHPVCTEIAFALPHHSGWPVG